MSRYRSISFDVEGYLDEEIGIQVRSMGKTGRELVCQCPFCGKDRKLYVSKTVGTFHCFSCKEGGNIVALVAEIAGVSRKTARGIVRGHNLDVGHSVSEARQGGAAPVEVTPRSRHDLPAEFEPIYSGRTYTRCPYIEDRGITYRSAKAFDLGVCRTGRYGGRLVMPIVEDSVNLSFVARVMGSGIDPKYIHPPGDDKDSLVYNIDGIVGSRSVVVVEGTIDAIAMSQKGFPTVALLGKAGNVVQALKLRRDGVRDVLVMLDPDAFESVTKKGRKPKPSSAVVTAVNLSEHLDVEVARLPAPYDPGDAPIEVVEQAIIEARPLKTSEMRLIRRALREERDGHRIRRG